MPIWDAKLGKWTVNGVPYASYEQAKAAAAGGASPTGTPAAGAPAVPKPAPVSSAAPVVNSITPPSLAGGAGLRDYSELSVADLTKRAKAGDPGITPGVVYQELLARDYSPSAAVAELKNAGINYDPSSGGPTTLNGSGATGGTSKPVVSGRIGQLVDEFEGFSDKDVINAYYQGELTRDELKQLIDIRNTSDKGVAKYTDASLERLLKQVDTDKPQKKLTKADLLGPQASNLAAKFNPKAEGFGTPTPLSSASGVSGTFDDLFGPGDDTGVIAAFDQYGNGEAAGLSLNGTQMRESDIERILAAYGLKGDKDIIGDAGTLSNVQAQRAMLAETNPNASPSDLARMIAIGQTGTDPATRRVDPSSGRFADLFAAPEPVGFAEGGSWGGGTFGTLRGPGSEEGADGIPSGRKPLSGGGFGGWSDDDSFGSWGNLGRNDMIDDQIREEQRAFADLLAAAKQARQRQVMGYRWDQAGLPWDILLDPMPLAGKVGQLPIGYAWGYESKAAQDARKRALIGAGPFKRTGEATRAAQPNRKVMGMQGFADGGDMVTEEPIIGIGLRTHEPRFVVSEGEMLNIEPLDKSFAATQQRKGQEEAIIGAASLLSEGGRKALSTLVHGRTA